MTELKSLFIDLGFEEVQTYIQSGNVVFKSNQTVALAETQIKLGILDQFGIDVPVFVIDLNKLNELAQANPYSFMEDKNIAFMHMTLLKSEVDEADFLNISEKKLPEDLIEYYKNAIYLYLPSGYGSTKLTNTFIENKLKTIATTRNWKTIQKMLSFSENL